MIGQLFVVVIFFFFHAEDGIRDAQESRGLGDVYKRQVQDCNAVWNGCLSVIREEISEQSFRTWFEPIRPIRLQENTLTLQVPNKFFFEWLEEHLSLIHI